MTLSDARTMLKMLTGQVDTVLLEMSNADIRTALDTAQRWWYDNIEKRVSDVSIKASMAANSWIVTPETTVLYPEIVEVYLVGGSADEAIPLEPMEWSELRNRQQADSTQAQPLFWAMRKIGGAAPTGTDQNKWELAVYPIPDATYEVRALARDYPSALGNDASSFQLGEYESRCVVVLAAILVAPGAARADLLDKLMWFFPVAVRDKVAALASHEEIAA